MSKKWTTKQKKGSFWWIFTRHGFCFSVTAISSFYLERSLSCPSGVKSYNYEGRHWPHLIKTLITSFGRERDDGVWESRPQGRSEGRVGKQHLLKNGRVRVLPWSGRPAGRECVVRVRVQQSSKGCVCVPVYKSERVQPVIAACSYFLKHNGAGAVIIFGLEWLINF